eukprot:3195963-Prymnesium_polylepis.1
MASRSTAMLMPAADRRRSRKKACACLIFVPCLSTAELYMSCPLCSSESISSSAPCIISFTTRASAFIQVRSPRCSEASRLERIVKMRRHTLLVMNASSGVARERSSPGFDRASATAISSASSEIWFKASGVSKDDAAPEPLVPAGVVCDSADTRVSLQPMDMKRVPLRFGSHGVAVGAWDGQRTMLSETLQRTAWPAQ